MHQVGFYYIDVKSCFERLKNCEKNSISGTYVLRHAVVRTPDSPN